MRICPQCNEETTETYCPKDNTRTVDTHSFENVERHDPMLGLILAEKYRIEELVGFGGFGSVYRGKHVQTGGPLAVKVLSRARVQDEAAVKRFYLEAENTHRLQHHNTVRLFDFGETDMGLLYLVMEYVEGKTLSDTMIESRRFSSSRVVRICEQVLKSLAEAHKKRVVHRDIKPDNIMLVNRMGDEDFVKVLDFGVSRTVGAEEKITVSGTVGTPAYIAPEQWSGDDEIDGRADLYSVGCLMYRLLTGNSPFLLDGKGPDIALQYLKAHMEMVPVPIEKHVRNCPPTLGSLVMSLLEKDPSNRPESAIVVIDKLRRLRESGVLTSEPLSMGIKDLFELEEEVNSKEITSYYGAPEERNDDAFSFTPSKPGLFRRLVPMAKRWGWKKPAGMTLLFLAVGIVSGLWYLDEAQRFFNKTHAPLNFPFEGESVRAGERFREPTEPLTTIQAPGLSETTVEEKKTGVEEPEPPRIIQLRSVPAGAAVFLKGEKRRIGRAPLDLKIDERITNYMEEHGNLQLVFRYSGRASEVVVISDEQLEDPDRTFKVVLKKKKLTWDY